MKKKNRIMLCIYLFLVLLIFYPFQIKAHPPEDVILNYDLNNRTLVVNIAHITKSPDTHYINKVEITKNGKVFGTYNYRNQPTPSDFTMKYAVPAVEGDNLELIATCTLYGSKAVKIIVKKQAH